MIVHTLKIIVATSFVVAQNNRVKYIRTSFIQTSEIPEPHSTGKCSLNQYWRLLPYLWKRCATCISNLKLWRHSVTKAK